MKLRQIDPQDLSHVVVDTADSAVWPQEPGSNVLELHAFGSERVKMIRVDSGDSFPIRSDPGGLEILVVKGSIIDDGIELSAESWLRIPADQENRIIASSKSLLWVKTGHLPS